MTWSTTRLVTLGSAIEERERLGQLLGTDSTGGFLLRSARLADTLPRRAGTLAVAGIAPELLVVRNSRLPVPENNGTLWAGRGASVLVRGGVVVQAGRRFRAILAPELAHARNLGYQSQPVQLGGQRPGTGSFSAPWFTGPYAIDFPTRFGDQPYTVFTLGQSAVAYVGDRVSAGVSTENQWWGPGTRNALLVSNAGEGMPHLFVRTARPLRTRLGDVEARWMLGSPTGSLHFAAGVPDTGSGRILNGAVATLRPSRARSLTVGVARLVLRADNGGFSPLRAFDVLFVNHHLGSGDTLRTNLRSDQLTSVFGRWVSADARAEVYGEFARLELPRSLRDFFLAPLNTGAYTFGVAHAWSGPRRGVLRGSAELTNLEQSRTFTDRPPPPDWYTGRSTPRGFTSRGQPIGAAIGPGSQQQWAALDYYTPRWQAGAFAQRIRHQNDALYRVFVTNAYRHDVSLAGGLRGGVRARGVDARATLTYTNRLNYLFQNGTFNFLGIGSVDVRNLTLALSISPAPRDVPRVAP